METTELATNKLIVLSIIQRMNNITLNQLTTLSLETLYMDYFDFVTAYEELCRDKMVVEAVRKGEDLLDAIGRPVTRCDLTEKGYTVLRILESRIPLPIRSYLAQACSGWKKDIRLKSTLTAEVSPDANGSFLVRLKQNDGIKDLVKLELTIPEKVMAQQICERWKRSPQTVYLGLLSVLTGEPVLHPEKDQSAYQQPDDEKWNGSITSSDFSAEPLSVPADKRQQTLFEEPSTE